MNTDGIAVESANGTTWCWGAVHLRPAAVLTDTRAYADVDHEQRTAETAAAERAWHAASWTMEHDVRYELRYVNDVGRRSVSCVLLVRARGNAPAETVRAITALRDRLAEVPRHVDAEVVADAEEVRGILAPGNAHPRGFFELRKPMTWSWCTRRAAGRAVCSVTRPLARTTSSWEPVWHELARLEHQTVVSICLRPFRVSPHLERGFHRLVAEYNALAVPAPPSPVWTISPPADPFAVAALPIHRELTRRYTTGRVWRLRVTVAASAPMGSAFPELLAITMGGATVHRPWAGDMDSARRNLATLGQAWLDQTYGQGAPAGVFNEAERVLGDLIDAEELTAVCRLPLEIPGHPPLFAVTDGAAHAPSGGFTPTGMDPGAPLFERE